MLRKMIILASIIGVIMLVATGCGQKDENDIKGTKSPLKVAVSNTTEWPKGLAADFVPKLNKGIVSYTLNAKQGCLIIVDKVTVEDYNKYVDAAIKAGYTLDKKEESADQSYYYSAKSAKGSVISVCFIWEEKSMNIMLDMSKKESSKE